MQDSSFAGAFVGRDQELAGLTRFCGDAVAGRGSVVLVDGEPGMGKTALADEVARRCLDAGWVTAWGGCLEGDGAPAYWPWLRVLRDLGEPGDFLTQPAAGDDTGSRYRMFDAVIGVLKRSSADGLLVVLDDLHWADPGSLRLLQVLSAEVHRQRMLVVGVYRHTDVTSSGAVGAALSAVLRERATRQLTLRGLGGAEIGRLAGTVLDGEPDPAVVRAVEERSEGNPFFALELLRLFRETGTAGPTLPTGVRETVGRRLGMVAPVTRSALRAASVFGREFTATMLATVTDQAVTEVLGLLDEAVAHELVASGSGSTFRFGHALTQEVCYAELELPDRQQLHARAAGELRSGDASAIDMRAHHLRQAASLGLAREAMAATVEAASRARNQLAYEHAAFQLQQALELVPLLDDGAVKREELLLELARCQVRSGAVADAWQSCRHAARLGLATGNAAVVADAATVIRGVSNAAADPLCGEINALCRRGLDLLGDTDPVRTARLLAQLAITGDVFADGSGHSEQALRAAEATGDLDARFLALQARQVELVHPRHVLERLSIGERAAAVGAESGRPDWQAWGLLWRIDAFWELSRRAQLDRELAALASVVDQLREPLMRWRLTLIKACLAEIEGRFDDARHLAGEALLIGRRGGNQAADFVDLIHRSRIARLTGSDAEEMVEAVRRFADGGPLLARMWLAVQLAGTSRDEEAAEIIAALTPGQLAQFPRPAPEWMPARTGTAALCVRFGHRELATVLYADLLPFGDRQVVAGAFTGSEGPVSRYLGMLARLLGDVEAAEAHLQSALDSAMAMSSPPYEALTRLELARLLLERRGTGDLTAAQEHLRAAGTIARRLGMRPLEADLAALTAAHPLLSAREAELAALIADGLSNRQIATRLHLSERTVESHVRNILTKLDFDRRTQIASWHLRRV